MNARLALLSCLALAGCQPPALPEGSYFSENIQPILQQGCVQQTTGCHIARAEGTAAGNLDLSSYDAMMRRRDLLPRFGPYPFGGLLMKVSRPEDLLVNTADPPDPAMPDTRTVSVRTDIRHAGGAGVSLTASGFATIRRYFAEGYTRTGVPREAGPTNVEQGACATGIGVNDFEVNRFGSTGPIDDAESFDLFVRTVQPMLRGRCAGSGCHSNPLRSFYLVCGDTDEERRWNFFQSTWHAASPVVLSELLRRPLAENRGGDYHLGGDIFLSADDPGYQALETWITDLVTRRPEVLVEDFATAGFHYFANRVEPLLASKGCMLQNCHSHISQNQDLQLFAGSQGYFPRATQHRNHGAALSMLALESPDPNQSRIIAKNLFPSERVPGGVGILHRGGSLLEDFPGGRASFDQCSGYDLDNGDLNEIPAYCILARWQQVERQVAIDSGRVSADPITAVVWVSRPLGVGEATDFDTYRPGADLLMADATLDAAGALSLGASRSLLAGCGLDSTTADARTPAVSWDATRIAFAARSSADEPLRLYWMNDDGSSCERIPGIASEMDRENGVLTHDFDPAFAPTGELVFASTRGNLDREAYDYQGPTRTPAAMEPNANLYVFAALSDPPVRQLTFMLDQEIQPAFTTVGRVVYMGEKREPGFHQLALRQQNLDGGDFRPAFGARGSIGFQQTTEPAPLLTHDLAFIAGPLHSPDGAGSLVIANQTLGVDDIRRRPDDRAYLPPMHRMPRSAFEGGRGVFRSPAVLPSHFILVSCDPTATSPADAPFDFDLCEADPATGRVRVVAGEAGRADVDAVAVFSRYTLSTEAVVPSDGERLDRPTMDAPGGDSLVRFHDFPMQVGLLFDNTRGVRLIPRGIRGFDLLEELPPPVEATSFDDVSEWVLNDDFGSMVVRRRSLGHAELNEDDSVFVRVPGGLPLLYRPTDGSGAPLIFGADTAFAGVPMQPREADQYYPGENSQRGIRRGLFNNVCGFCHAGISGRELDVTVEADVVTSASVSLASVGDPVNLAPGPGGRGPIEGP
ncbi:MAG: hypothetical protein GXP55_13615 [Deltaproteobacteria bacterium]|nr:hypothetical protein [Deltaproteobacteria bacterium]